MYLTEEELSIVTNEEFSKVTINQHNVVQGLTKLIFDMDLLNECLKAEKTITVNKPFAVYISHDLYLLYKFKIHNIEGHRCNNITKLEFQFTTTGIYEIKQDGWYRMITPFTDDSPQTDPHDRIAGLVNTLRNIIKTKSYVVNIKHEIQEVKAFSRYCVDNLDDTDAHEVNED